MLSPKSNRLTRVTPFKMILYESIKREVKIKPISEGRYDERLLTKDEESTSLEYTGFLGDLEHLKIKTRLIDEKFFVVYCVYYYESRLQKFFRNMSFFLSQFFFSNSSSSSHSLS
jgi:hypothetical protein